MQHYINTLSGHSKIVSGKKMNEEDWLNEKNGCKRFDNSFLVVGAVPALGAVDQGKLNEIKALTQQMNTIKVQIVEKEVEAGILDKAKAEKIKNAIQERQKKIEQDIDKGEFHGFRHKKGGGHKHSTNSPAPQKME